MTVKTNINVPQYWAFCCNVDLNVWGLLTPKDKHLLVWCTFQLWQSWLHLAHVLPCFTMKNSKICEITTYLFYCDIGNIDQGMICVFYYYHHHHHFPPLHKWFVCLEFAPIKAGNLTWTVFLFVVVLLWIQWVFL